jgi:hypothetical protein
MIICIRYFFEKTDNDYQKYNTQWDENLRRIIFLETDMPETKQITLLQQDIQNNQDKDILAIRFPNKDIVNKNEIIKRIINGEGIAYNNGFWFPNEIWIYNPL